MVNHPCQSCGACCAYFRVSFHWSETLPESHEVPFHLTEKISEHRSAMIGTGLKKPSCIAFKGIIGGPGACEIYENRPSACRSFEASFENGTKNIRCEDARSSKGLAHLTLADWI